MVVIIIIISRECGRINRRAILSQRMSFKRRNRNGQFWSIFNPEMPEFTTFRMGGIGRIEHWQRIRIGIKRGDSVTEVATFR
jgi:hypothetical protein